MDRTGETRIMILNRKSEKEVAIKSKTDALVETSKKGVNKDKIPIIIKDMQFTLKKY